MLLTGRGRDWTAPEDSLIGPVAAAIVGGGSPDTGMADREGRLAIVVSARGDRAGVSRVSRSVIGVPGGAWWIVAINAGVGLIAGANVFGLENRAQTYRFLNHHGARPRLVWLVKLAVWSLGLALIWVPQSAVAALAPRRLEPYVENGLGFWSTPLLFFAVAQLAGMVIRRGITAMVVSLVLGLALAVAQIEPIIEHMLPVEGLLVVPAVLLVVSWAWSGDWLFDRPAPGRWLRLGLLLIEHVHRHSGLLRGLSRMEHPRSWPDHPASSMDGGDGEPAPRCTKRSRALLRCGAPACRSRYGTQERGGSRSPPPRGRASGLPVPPACEANAGRSRRAASSA